MAPLALVTGLILTDGADPSLALPLDTPQAMTRDPEAARFHRCIGGARYDCVIDGDTFWYQGEKIRLLGINAPEVGAPRCAREAALGEKASQRLLVLLNQGPFTLHSNAVDNRDRYDRLLRDVTRNGHSLGETMVAEGLAERWKGYSGNWC
jgi:micrococcal nuclease